MSREAMEGAARDMGDRLRHRGPDDADVWVESACGVALSHRRLAIIDLTQQGHQPMVSADQRFIIVFNGEIYNFAQLRAELEERGHRFRGASDTEVMLTAFCEWGVEAALARFNGMFAFGAWDRKSEVLWLARDRLGEKPLYFGWIGRSLVFASELKALRAFPGFQGEIDREALTLFFRFNYISSPYSIFSGYINCFPAQCCAGSEAMARSGFTDTGRSPKWRRRAQAICPALRLMNFWSCWRPC